MRTWGRRGSLALGVLALLAACSPQVVVSTGATNVASEGGNSAGATASNSATGGSASNEGSLSAGATGGSASAGAEAGAQAGAVAGANVGGGPTTGASSAPGASGAAASAAPSVAPSAAPTPMASIAPSQVLWKEDFELAKADAVPGWTGFAATGLGWRGLRSDAGEGAVSLALCEPSGEVLSMTSTQLSVLRHSLDLSQAKKPRLRLMVKAGGVRPDLVSLTVSLGNQSLSLAADAAWTVRDLDLAAWAGNQGNFTLEGKLTHSSGQPTSGPAVDAISVYEAQP